MDDNTLFSQLYNPDRVLDTDFLAELAKENPDLFERARRLLLNDVINRAPEGQRENLLALQEQVNIIMRNPDGLLVLAKMITENLNLLVEGVGDLKRIVEKSGPEVHKNLRGILNI